MAGELAGFDVLPAGLVDRIVAWSFMKYGLTAAVTRRSAR